MKKKIESFSANSYDCGVSCKSLIGQSVKVRTRAISFCTVTFFVVISIIFSYEAFLRVWSIFLKSRDARMNLDGCVSQCYREN